MVQMVWNRMKPLRPYHQVQIRETLQELAPAILGHTAHDPDHEIRIRFLAFGQIAGLANSLLLGLISDAASI